MTQEYMLIALMAWAVLIVVFYFYQTMFFEMERCKHKSWVQYHSKGCRVCIDCGKIEFLKGINS